MPTTAHGARAKPRGYHRKTDEKPTRSNVFSHTPDNVLFCLAFQHIWVHDTEWEPQRAGALYGVRIAMRCESCGSARHDVVGWKGQLIQRRYNRPDGYKVKVDGRRGTRKEQARREYLARRG